MARKPRKPATAKRARKTPERKPPVSAQLVKDPEILADDPHRDSPELESGEAPEEIVLKPEAVDALDPETIDADGDDDAILGAAEAAEVAAERQAALVPYDPLSRYLAEVRRFPLLTREEEVVIAKRYAEHQNPEDAFRLVTANLRLVVKIAMEFSRASKNLLDLIQEGNVGLMEAVKNFDPYRGIRFPSYAVWWIRAYLYRYLINNWRLVKIGTTQAQRKLFFNLKKETDRLEAEGFAPQPKLIAQRMGVKESEVREMQERMAQSEVSLDQPVPNTEDTRLLDVLPDPSGSPEDVTAGEEFRNFAKEKVHQFEDALTDEKEQEIFRTRLLSEDPITLQEIGERFGISRERVRQIETRLKKKLREFLKKQAGDIEQAGP
ncbi:MAG TPA: RNA polymerase factor sigma-32 [Candidatus Binataceae bacterium]|nr:RNA polymerase factor sigma-32 [Candidatus Binataceae bacterium]